MIDLEKVKTLKNHIPFLGIDLDQKEFLRQFVELVATNLSIYFVGIYLVDESKENVVLIAGNGEIGEHLLKYAHRARIFETPIYAWQLSNAAFHGQVRLVDWLGKRIASFDTENVIEINSETISDKYFCSPIIAASRTELYLPLRQGNKTFGVMELTFDIQQIFDNQAIGNLQSLANGLAVVISSQK